MKRKLALIFFFLTFLLSVFLLVEEVTRPADEVRGKGSAVPLTDSLTPEQTQAQALALADGRVQAYLIGGRSEVFGVRYVAYSENGGCETGCYQVEIYRFDTNTAVLALVNLLTQQVQDVLHMPNHQPGINKRLADQAITIATTHPTVIEALGYQPSPVGVAAVHGSLVESSCEAGHLCVSPTFRLEDRFLWAVVDLTEQKLAGITWTDSPPDGPFIPFTPQGCPAPGHVEQNGWVLDYWTTPTDGFEVYDVYFNGILVLKGAKLVEWHVDYGNSGFIDVTGCGGSGGGFPIYPYGETQMVDITENDEVVGFELIQDFRMSQWGATCNYRYEQHMQFYQDGRFRIVGGAFGKGCGPISTYRPVTRINLAVNGDEDDSFGYFEADQWQIPFTETYRTPYEAAGHGPHTYNEDGYLAWVMDNPTGTGFYIEPGQGQFNDAGRGDSPFLYFTVRQADEGGSGDLPAFPSSYCCYNDHRQGPELYVNDEPINGANVVLWYAPQHETEASFTEAGLYCWTVAGEPNPETYPCFGGPMFVPFGFDGAEIAADFIAPTQVITFPETAVFTNTTIISGGIPVNYHWDFGDNTSSTAINPPPHLFGAGSFTVTLTAQGIGWGSDTAVHTIHVIAPYTTYLPIIKE